MTRACGVITGTWLAAARQFLSAANGYPAAEAKLDQRKVDTIFNEINLSKESCFFMLPPFFGFRVQRADFSIHNL